MTLLQSFSNRVKITVSDSEGGVVGRGFSERWSA